MGKLRWVEGEIFSSASCSTSEKEALQTEVTALQIHLQVLWENAENRQVRNLAAIRGTK